MVFVVPGEIEILQFDVADAGFEELVDAGNVLGPVGHAAD